MLTSAMKAVGIRRLRSKTLRRNQRILLRRWKHGKGPDNDHYSAKYSDDREQALQFSGTIENTDHRWEKHHQSDHPKNREQHAILFVENRLLFMKLCQLRKKSAVRKYFRYQAHRKAAAGTEFYLFGNLLLTATGTVHSSSKRKSP